MNVIETVSLTKNFGRVAAVKGISLNVRKGEIYGFLGLNGAGKTTTIRALLGMIKPTSGSIKLFGKELSRGGINWNDVGYLVELPYSYPDLTVKQNLEIYKKLRGLNDGGVIPDVLKKLRLYEYADRKARHLSQGNSQRLGIAKALMHNPKLLLLDEPINGLDPEGIVEIRELLKSLAYNDGATIFLSSHILSEISKLATRIGIIHEGGLINEINASELEDLLDKHLIIGTADNERAKRLLKDAGYNFTNEERNGLKTSDKEAVDSPEKIVELLVGWGLTPRKVYVSEEDLESYFLRITGSRERTE